MLSDAGPRPLVALIGPTASGKSALAMALARNYPAEIVSCDSVQVYRGFDAGSAKPSLVERTEIPHHLIDVATAEDEYSAADYSRDARRAVHEIAGRRKLPVVVGGTGFYLAALLEGLPAGPGRQEELRARLEERALRRPQSLHRILSRLDPASARRIHPHNLRKLIRAIEVCLTGRAAMAQVLQSGRKPLEGFGVLSIGLDPRRDLLYERINRRTREMFEGGLVEEVGRHVANGVHPGAKPMLSVGYRQALAVIRGELPVELAIADAAQKTRHYARRQWTWFRHRPGIYWVAGFGDERHIKHRVFEEVTAFLKNFAFL